MKRYSLIILLFATHLIVEAQISIIAHRGFSFIAPENTVAAANLAWEQNTDAVELDVYLTSDNRVVVIHDSNNLSSI
jgi:glycerophosphoryl diester phosphodiesterase